MTDAELLGEALRVLLYSGRLANREAARFEPEFRKPAEAAANEIYAVIAKLEERLLNE